MSNTARRTIDPKVIDANSNETELDQYIIDVSYDSSANYASVALPNADKFITLPTNDNHKMIELISDQPLTFAIYEEAGTLIKEFEDVKNIVMNFNAVKNFSYKIKNKSGSDAEVTWRLYS